MDIVVQCWQVFIVCTLALLAGTGLLAMASPAAFAAVVGYSNQLIHSSKREAGWEKWVDIDGFVLKHARYFGFLVTCSVVYLGFLSTTERETSSNSFLVIIVGVSLGMGILSLVQIAKQKHQIESHLLEAHTDALTGLFNRRAFDIELARRLTQHQRQGTVICLLIIDIDNFKTFNDSYGHHVGDTVLTEIAKRVSELLPPEATAARIGGDEFAVILTGNDLIEASGIAEDARKAIVDHPLHFEGKSLQMTLSIGLAEARVEDDANSLLKRSDSALYAAKDAGRNCCYRQGSPEPAVPAPCA